MIRTTHDMIREAYRKPVRTIIQFRRRPEESQADTALVTFGKCLFWGLVGASLVYWLFQAMAELPAKLERADRMERERIELYAELSQLQETCPRCTLADITGQRP